MMKKLVEKKKRSKANQTNNVLQKKIFLYNRNIFFIYNTVKMKVKIYWEEGSTKELFDKVKNILDELGLVDFIELAETSDDAIKTELGIKESPALIIEEEAIDFKDVIFEWVIPEDDEIKSMFTSIIWWGEGWWCAPEWCGSGCSC